jgi:methionyl aminopeptidase
MVKLKSSSELDLMRKSGNAVSEVLREIGAAIKDGISTYELDLIAKDAIKARNALPAFLGYKMTPYHPPYPGVICASINQEVVHGIPSKKRKLRNGDIISIDVGLKLNGYYGDTAFTFPVGEISPKAQHLLDVTHASLHEGIKAAKPGNRIGDIAFAVQAYVESHGCSVVRDFVGHGLGRSLHEDPQVPNYGEPKKGTRLKPGMVIAIEPMVNLGSSEVKVLDDDWTVVSLDGNLSAHFEHTVAILSDGPEILTWF